MLTPARAAAAALGVALLLALVGAAHALDCERCHRPGMPSVGVDYGACPRCHGLAGGGESRLASEVHAAHSSVSRKSGECAVCHAGAAYGCAVCHAGSHGPGTENCLECHTPLPNPSAAHATEERLLASWGHAWVGKNCQACHFDKTSLFRLASGVPLEDSYTLCWQCHSYVFEESPESHREGELCVKCHDPHGPISGRQIGFERVEDRPLSWLTLATARVAADPAFYVALFVGLALPVVVARAV